MSDPLETWRPLSERLPWHFPDSYTRPNGWPARFRLFTLRRKAKR